MGPDMPNRGPENSDAHHPSRATQVPQLGSGTQLNRERAPRPFLEAYCAKDPEFTALANSQFDPLVTGEA